MKIRRFDVASIDLPLREGYRIANQTITFARNVLVRAEAEDGSIGLGGALHSLHRNALERVGRRGGLDAELGALR